MGANLETRIKVTQRQMRLISALKLVPVFPVPQAAMPAPEKPTVISIMQLPNRSVPSDDEMRSNNAPTAMPESSRQHRTSNGMPANSNITQLAMTPIIRRCDNMPEMVRHTEDYKQTELPPPKPPILQFSHNIRELLKPTVRYQESELKPPIIRLSEHITERAIDKVEYPQVEQLPPKPPAVRISNHIYEKLTDTANFQQSRVLPPCPPIIRLSDHITNMGTNAAAYQQSVLQPPKPTIIRLSNHISEKLTNTANYRQSKLMPPFPPVMGLSQHITKVVTNAADYPQTDYQQSQLLPLRQPNIRLSKQIPEIVKPTVDYQTSDLVIEIDMTDESDTDSIHTEISSGAGSSSTMKAAQFAEKTHKSNATLHSLLQRTSNMMADIKNLKSPTNLIDETRSNYLESWEESKISDMLAVEKMFTKILDLKDKIKRIKKTKIRLTKQRDEEKAGAKRVKREEMIVEVNPAQVAHIGQVRTNWIFQNPYTLQANKDTPDTTHTSSTTFATYQPSTPTSTPILYATTHTTAPYTPPPTGSYFQYPNNTTTNITAPTSAVRTTPHNLSYQNYNLLMPTTLNHAYMPQQINTNTPSLKRPAKRPPKRITPVKPSIPFQTVDLSTLPCDEFDLYTIGPNGTKIAKAALDCINWGLTGAAVTRKILMEVFHRDILATHTLTGKPSPAFLEFNMPAKGKLDTDKVADVIYFATKFTDLTDKEVRQAITTKCADENKMWRARERRQLRLLEEE